MKILVINPGAVSTKIAVYDERTRIFYEAIEHSAGELAGFSGIAAQKDFRKTGILRSLQNAGYSPTDFDAVCARGGLLRHVPSGTYRINRRALEDSAHCPYGEHAANLGVLLAAELAEQASIPGFFADPVSVDELSPLARVSGLAGMERKSYFHALNQKSTARRAAALLSRPYEQVNLIVAHLGGGVSVAAHQKGRVVDVYNVRDDGAMGMDRGGALPVNAVVELCFSGKTKAEVKELLGSQAGVYSYLGTKDLRQVEQRAFVQKEEKALLIFRALSYQLAKDIGAMAAVLRFAVDAVVFTGGMANSQRLCDEIAAYVGALAPVLRLPGEQEMQALAEAALGVLHGAPALEY